MGHLEFVIVTGMSGAGKTQALRSLEDLGFFCVDNLPPALVPKFAELCQQTGGNLERVALGIDIRGGQFFDDLFETLGALEKIGFVYRILFLEASDSVLVRRFKETRRPHPMKPQGRVLEGIELERRKLQEIRGKANFIIDTSDLTPRRLQEEILAIFKESVTRNNLLVHIISFGYKHGIPMDSDLVLDVRFLPNPHYVESLRHLRGTDPGVIDYVLKWPITSTFLDKLLDLLDFLLPNYVNEGKTQLTVAIGCTGGHHRSMVIAGQIEKHLKGKGYPVTVQHRDCDRGDY